MISFILFLLVYPFTLFADNSYLSDDDIKRVRAGETVVWNMSRQQRHVALTFDDGPDHIYTPQILDVLAKANVKATFFVVGHMVQKYPHIIRRIHYAGHDIANHTWAHYRLDEMSEHQIQLQMAETTKILDSVGVPMASYFRPPGGRYNNYVVMAAKDQNMKVVMWDVNAADYKKMDGSLPSTRTTVQRVISRVQPGSIILMHNSVVAVQALPKIIDQLKQDDYTIGKLAWN